MKRKSIVPRLATVLLIVAASVVMTQAQPRGFGHRGPMDPEERLEARLGFLTQELALDEQQVEAVRAALEKGHSDARAWHDANPDASRDDRRAFRDEHREAIEAAIKEVLNDEQKSTFEELKDRRGKMGPRGRDGLGGPGGPGGPGMGARLDLSDKQRADLDAIRDALQEEVATWRKNNPNPTREEKDAFWAAHRAKRMELMSDVLDEAQMASFKKGMQKDHRRFHRNGEHGGFGQGIHALDLSDEQMESLRGILSADQNETLDRMLDAPGGPRFGGPRGEGMERIFDQLDLTEQQETHLREMRENHRAAAKAWHDANPNATRAERQAFREAHREGMKAQLRSVLTEEQIQKLESLRDEHRHGNQRGMHGMHGMHGRDG